MAVDHFIEQTESDPGYGQLLSVLWRQRLLLLGVFLSVLSVSTALSFTKKPIYQSAMQLLVEPNYQGKKDTTTENQFADSNVEIDNSTQLAQMRSSQLLSKAVTLLKKDYPNISVEELQSSLVLVQLEEDKVKTKIFQVVYTSDDPVKTQKALRAIQQVYKDYNRDQQKQRLERGLSFVNEQLPVVERQVEQAEQDLKTFRKSENLVDPEVQSRAIVDSLTSVQREKELNRAQIREVQTRSMELQQRVNRSPQQALIAARISQSPRYQSLLNEIQKTELSLVQQRVRFKSASPFVQQVEDQRQRQLSLLSNEIGRIVDGSSQQGGSGSALTKGQLGETDIKLINEMVEAQVSLASLNARAQSLSETEQSLKAELRRYPALLAEYNRLQPQVQLRRDTLQQLLKARQEIALEIARGGFDWQVVEEPKLGQPIGSSLMRNLLLGAIAGLMLGAIAAFVRDGMDDSLHNPDDLKKQTTLPLLGMVPKFPDNAHPPAIARLMRSDGFSPSVMEMVHWQPFRESLDLIYKNLQLLPSADGLRSLVVTSTLAGEGKSTLALGLAISAARLHHKKVLLIDADLRRPSLHKQLGLSNGQGLSTLLVENGSRSSQDDFQLSCRYSDIPISVLTSGPSPSDPAKLLSSQRMADLVATFEQTYDLVVIDAPPILGIVDALLAASFCDGVVLVNRLGKTSRHELNQAMTILSKLNVLGIVANGTNPSTSPYFYYEKTLQSAIP